MKNETASAPREALDSGVEEQDALFEDLLAGEQKIERRRLLGWMVAAVVSILGAGFFSVLRSLGTDPTSVLTKPAWKRGDMLVNAGGKPILVDTLELGSVITVYPQGRVGSLAAETLLIRVEEALLHLPKARAGWAPMGNVAFSRICTHAGCPVALYEAKEHLLLCPCHQSTFNVLAAAAPTSGPAARALPQLPLYVDSNGYLRAGGDFTEPPGPGFWNLPS
jgi:ubiquinol-cytochrome c reductase iron-sulfur subunit